MNITTVTSTTECALSLEGVGAFTSVEDSKVTTPNLPSVPFNYAHPIHAHLDVDAEYQTDKETGVITPCVVGWRDYVSGHKGLQDRYTDDRCIWDKVYGTRTVKLLKSDLARLVKRESLESGESLTIVLYIFSTINDVRFSTSKETWDNLLLPDLLPITEQKRRIKITRDEYGKPQRLTHWYCIKDGIYRPLTLVIQDVSAFLGLGGLSGYSKMVGIELPNKKDLDAHKEHMNDVWSGVYGQELKEKLGVYCVGDLVNREIWLKANTEFAPLISEALKLPKPMKFAGTMGSTVAGILQGLVSKEILSHQTFNEETLAKNCTFEGIGGHVKSTVKGSLDEKVTTLIQMVNAYGTSDLLRKENHGNSPTTGRWLAKVDGGRAKNERPEVATYDGVVADVDLGGAYASTMVNLCTYPIGRPSVLQMSEGTWEVCRASYQEAKKEKVTLRQVLSKYEKTFINGLWYMRVSKIQDKTLPVQTLVQSQILPSLVKMSNYESDCDDDDDVNETVEKIDGSLTLLTGELEHGTITFNELEILKRVCTQNEFSNLLDGLLVESLVWYPKDQQTDDVMEVLGSPNLKDGTSHLFDAGVVLNGKVNQSIYTIGSKWYGMPMSKMIAPLQSLRSVYPKKSPLNDLYKLFCNTAYGVLASVYFPTGNVCVASNITSTIRCGAWLMRASLNTVQSITDGGACLLNKVHKAPERMSLRGVSLSNTYNGVYQGTELSGITHNSHYVCDEIPLLFDETGAQVFSKVTWVSKDSPLWRRNNDRLTKEGMKPLESGYWKLTGYQVIDGVEYPSTFLNSKGELVYDLTQYNGGLAEIDRLLYAHTRRFFDDGKGTDTTGITILDGFALNIKPKSKDGTPVPNPKSSSLEVLNDFASHHIDLSDFTQKNTTRGVIAYESKELYDGITVHGQCDYLLIPFGLKSTNDEDIKASQPVVKWRGQDLKEKTKTFESDGITPYRSICESIELTTMDEDGLSETYISIPSWVLKSPHPAKDVLFLLRSGIKLVPIVRLASQPRWMKVNNYKKHIVSKTVKDGTVKRVDLGDDQLIPIRVSYCSASQFIYRTLKQRDSWIKYQDTLKEKTGFRLEFDYLVQVEGEYMVDVQSMIRDLAWKIQRGEMPPSLNGIKWCDQPKHPDFGKMIGVV